MWKTMGHQLPPILHTPTKKIQHKFHLLVLGTWALVETSLHVKYLSQSDNRVFVTSELQRLHTTKFLVLHRSASHTSYNGDGYNSCGIGSLRDSYIAPKKHLNQHSLNQPKQLQNCLYDLHNYFGSNDPTNLLITQAHPFGAATT